MSPQRGGSGGRRPERAGSLQGIFNFRDLGGRPNVHGETVRRGLVYRSGALHEATPGDLEVLASLGIEVVYDLRTKREQQRRAELPGARVVSLPIFSREAPRHDLSAATDAEAFLTAVYRSTLEHSAPAFAALFEGLAAPGGLPAVFHCTVGKDRTGLAAALLLAALDVDEEEILADYELTALAPRPAWLARLVDEQVARHADPAVAAGVFGTQPGALATVLGELRERWGGVRAYLEEQGGLAPGTIDLLQDRLVSEGPRGAGPGPVSRGTGHSGSTGHSGRVSSDAGPRAGAASKRVREGGQAMAATWSFELFIDGAWEQGEGGNAIEVINPATEEPIGSVPEATAKDAVRAIEAARRAFDEGPWPWMKPAERAAVLRKMGQALLARSAELHDLIVAQTGSVGFVTDAIQAAGSIGMFFSNADLAEHSFQWVEVDPPTGAPTGMAGSALVREPVGVVGAITPFNFPFMLNVVKTAPALAAGCTVVLKPHPWTPLDAFLIAQAAEEAGVPPGVLNVVPGGAEVGETLTTSPMVDMITMTGSTATGRRIMAAGAPTMKRLHLELGGKSAQVVLDDVSEDYARSIGFGAVLVHCGQGCVIQTRLLLPEHLLDAYKEGVRQALGQVKIGDPRDPDTTLGPLIREQQRQRVEGLVASGIEEGAEVLCGAKRPEGFEKGFFYEPTVLVGANHMRIAQEEIFGPVLTVIPYSGKDADAVRIANDSIYGLGGGVIAANTSRAFNVARQIRAGSMSAQGVGSAAVADLGPGGGQGPGWGLAPAGIGQRGAFGGYKHSGVGREWGHHGFAAFTEVKSISWS